MLIKVSNGNYLLTESHYKGKSKPETIEIYVTCITKNDYAKFYVSALFLLINVTLEYINIINTYDRFLRAVSYFISLKLCI